MQDKITVKIITQNDLIESGCLDIGNAINIVENAIKKYNENKVIFPDKVSVIFNEKTQDRINCLPAAILDDKVYGMKWVSVFPENPKKYNSQNVTAVTLISELEKGFPKAFIEATMCSNLRTASVGAIAAKYLANKNSKTIGFIGAGEQAKTHFLTMKHICKELDTCYVSSKTIESQEKFVEQMSKFYPEVKFVLCGEEYQRAVENSDIIVTAISGQEPVLKAEWIKSGAFYCHVGGFEDEYKVAQKANKIVCDDWNVVKHRTQTLSRMYKDGLLKDEDIYANINEIISKYKTGRENENEFIYFNSVGLSYIDIALANDFVKKAENKGKGLNIDLQTKNMFDIEKGKFIL